MGQISYEQKDKNGCLQNGFALIELLLSMGLTIFLFTISIQSFLLIKERLEHHKENLILHEEAAAFIHFLESEIGGAKDIQISKERILFSRHGDRLEYRKQGDRIIRKKNGLGFVTVCFYVKEFTLVQQAQGIELDLILVKNRRSIEISTIIDLTIDSS